MTEKQKNTTEFDTLDATNDAAVEAAFGINQAIGDYSAANDRHSAIKDDFREGLADPRAAGLAAEAAEYDMFFAEQREKVARKELKKAERPLSIGRRMAQLVVPKRSR